MSHLYKGKYVNKNRAGHHREPNDPTTRRGVCKYCGGETQIMITKRGRFVLCDGCFVSQADDESPPN